MTRARGEAGQPRPVYNISLMLFVGIVEARERRLVPITDRSDANAIRYQDQEPPGTMTCCMDPRRPSLCGMTRGRHFRLLSRR